MDPFVVLLLLGCVPLVSTQTNGWFVQGSYYYKLWTTPQIWKNAENHCVSQGAHLTSFHNAVDEKAVSLKSMPNMYWIGAKLPDGVSFTWSDGSAVDYNNFKYKDNKPTCGSVYFPYKNATMYWVQTLCDTSLPYICLLDHYD